MRTIFCASGGLGELTQALAVARLLRKDKKPILFISRDEKLLGFIKNEGYSSCKVNSPEESIKIIKDFNADFVFMCNSKTAYFGKSATLKRKPVSNEIVCCLDSNWLFLNDTLHDKRGNLKVPEFLDRIYILFPENLYKSNLLENGGHYKIKPYFKKRIVATGFIPGGLRISKKDCEEFRRKNGIAKEDKLVFVYFGQKYKKIKHYFEKIVNDVFSELNDRGKVWLMSKHEFDVCAPWYVNIKKPFKNDKEFETAIAAADLVIQHHGMGTLPKCLKHQTPVLCYVPSIKKELPYYEHLEIYEVRPFFKLGVCGMVAYEDRMSAKKQIKELIYNKKIIREMKSQQKLHFSPGEKKCYSDMKRLLKERGNKL